LTGSVVESQVCASLATSPHPYTAAYDGLLWSPASPRARLVGRRRRRRRDGVGRTGGNDVILVPTTVHRINGGRGSDTCIGENLTGCKM
jgi:hypothetical protein